MFETRLTHIAGYPPKKVGGTLIWTAMHDEMSGYHEVRDKAGKKLYRVFCKVDSDIENSDRPVIAIIDARVKELDTKISDAEYRAIRALGEEYLSRNPRSLRPPT